MKSLIKKVLVSSIVAGVVSSAIAGEVNPCNVASWTITGAIQSQYYNPDQPNFIPTGAISTTTCVGVYAGNDESGGTLDPKPNLGYLNDGLLNGEGDLISPTQFLNPTSQVEVNGSTFVSTSELQKINPDATNVEDPGWIMLGYGEELGEAGTGSFAYRSITIGNQSYSLSDYLTFSVTHDYTMGGTWTLLVDADIVQQLADIGMDRSVFDHLAFSVKAGDYWAVYDFDFTILNQMYPGAFDLSKPYSLTGSWTTNDDFYNSNDKGQAISHFGVWARDPLPPNQVPAPATLLLLGTGLVALGMMRKLSFKS